MNRGNRSIEAFARGVVDDMRESGRPGLPIRHRVARWRITVLGLSEPAIDLVARHALTARKKQKAQRRFPSLRLCHHFGIDPVVRHERTPLVIGQHDRMQAMPDCLHGLRAHLIDILCAERHQLTNPLGVEPARRLCRRRVAIIQQRVRHHFAMLIRRSS